MSMLRLSSVKPPYIEHKLAYPEQAHVLAASLSAPEPGFSSHCSALGPPRIGQQSAWREGESVGFLLRRRNHPRWTGAGGMQNVHARGNDRWTGAGGMQNLHARGNDRQRWRRRDIAVSASSSAAVPSSVGDGFDLHPAVKEGLGKLGGSDAPPLLSDIVWSAAGGFVAMAAMGYLDKLLLPRGLSFSLGSFGAVCMLLFASPKAPVAAKYNVFVSHIFCALTGVVALAAFGPGWAAKATALAACIAFMQFTGSVHPPAAGLPLIFIDAPKWHVLKWWYVLFPGVVGCLFLFLLAEAVAFLKQKFRF